MVTHHRVHIRFSLSLSFEWRQRLTFSIHVCQKWSHRRKNYAKRQNAEGRRLLGRSQCLYVSIIRFYWINLARACLLKSLLLQMQKIHEEKKNLFLHVFILEINFTQHFNRFINCIYLSDGQTMFFWVKTVDCLGSVQRWCLFI